MAERTIDVRGAGGVRLHVRTFDPPAAGPDLLLHHGLASSSHIWDLMLPRLTRRFRVVAYDARGHGRSGKPSSGYGFARLAEDARAVIRATRLHRPIVAGHSWGAMVALHVGAHAPRSVAGVVMIDGGVGNLAGQMDWEETRELLAPPPVAGVPLDRFRRMIPSFFGDAIEVTPEIERIVLSVMHVGRDGRIRPRLSRANHLRILREIWKQDHHERHRRLRVRAIAILSHGAGDPDWDAAKRRAAVHLREIGVPTRITWIEGIHDLPLQHPERLCRRIERFAAGIVG
jgi:pimeloyl-ACP methyl ester carboxylesterase